MRSGLLGQMNNPSANGVNGHLPGDALAAGRLPGNRNLRDMSLLSGVLIYTLYMYKMHIHVRDMQHGTLGNANVHH